MLSLLFLTSLLLSILPSLTHSQSVPGPYPVIAHFSFDTDYTSQFNNYTSFAPSTATPPPIVASQSSVACPFNDCASFTGQHYLDISPWLPLLGAYDGEALTSWSVSLWVKAEAGGYQGLLGEWGEGSYVWSLRLINYSPQLLWIYRNANSNENEVVWTSASTVSSTSWSHLVLNFNLTSQTFQFYIDGIVTDTFHSAAAYNYLGGEPALGWKIGMIDDVMYGLSGAIDELWAFSTALTANDVLLLHAINSIGSCAPGTAGVAQYNVGTCQTCEAGYYSANIGELVCTICPVGTTSTAGSSACQACASGTYSSQPGGTCQSCPAGYYAPAPGTSECLPCTAGTFASAGATTCTYCPANTLSPAASIAANYCVACPAGSSGGGSIPVCCPNGVSPAGQLLATTGLALSNFGAANTCVLNTDVLQDGEVVEFIGDYCGAGYDTVLTNSLQSVYSDFSAFQLKAGTTALQQIYCNP